MRHLTRVIIIFVASLLPGIASSTVVYSQGGFPKIALMFAHYHADLDLSPARVAEYDLVVDGGLFSGLGDQGMAEVRRINPYFRGLHPHAVAYVDDGHPILSDSGFKERYLLHYVSSPPCQVNARVVFPGWSSPIYAWNFASSDAVAFRAQYLVQAYRSMTALSPHSYDGIFLDGMHLTPPWYAWYPSAQFDVNCDGVSDAQDSQTAVAPIWQQEVLSYVSSLRANLPDALMLANDAKAYPSAFPQLQSLMNGVESELDVSHFLDYRDRDWYQDIYAPMSEWTDQSLPPPLSLINGLYSSQPIFNPTPGQLEQGRQAYQRMRFGLATALMSGNYYLYDLSANYDAQSAYWYDEYDNGRSQVPGYLGMPLGPAIIVDPVSVSEPNLLLNGSFESTDVSHVCASNNATGLDHWCMEDHLGRGTVSQDCTAAHSGSCSMKANLSPGPSLQPYQFQLKQTGFQVRDGDAYTLSFRGKAEAPRVMSLEITRDVANWESLTGYRAVQLSTDWRLYQVILHLRVPTGVPMPAPEQTRLAFYFGQDLPAVWLDDISLQAGASGVYRRDFEHGIALINTLDESKAVDLGGTFRHIRGEQDSTVNTGALATDITLPAKDAIIMTNLIHALCLPLIQQR
jgi:hypothetical protein